MFVLALSAIAGCDQSDRDVRLENADIVHSEVVPLSGSVRVDGHPGVQLVVCLVQASETGLSQSSPRTVTDEQGRFRFSTFLDGDGVPPGDYRVLVEKLQKIGSSGWSGPDQLKNLYNHLDTPAATVAVLPGQRINNLAVELNVSEREPKQPPPYGRLRTGKPLRSQSDQPD